MSDLGSFLCLNCDAVNDEDEFLTEQGYCSWCSSRKLVAIDEAGTPLVEILRPWTVSVLS